jgi:hypothetical protein
MLFAICPFVLGGNVCLHNTSHREFVRESWLCTFSSRRISSRSPQICGLRVDCAREVLLMRYPFVVQVRPADLLSSITSAFVHCAAAT